MNKSQYIHLERQISTNFICCVRYVLYHNTSQCVNNHYNIVLNSFIYIKSLVSVCIQLKDRFNVFWNTFITLYK